MYEVSMHIRALEMQDRLEWNRVSSFMALYANTKSSKKKYSPDDFHPYLQIEKTRNEPKTRDDVLDLVDKMKNFNGK